MVFDAHNRAFAFFRGTCTRGIYDSEAWPPIGPRPGQTKTAVEAVFVGKERLYNRRFHQMCSHHLVQPPSIGLKLMAHDGRPCTPASGWKKGQVANQVGLVRERFFTPRLRLKSLSELNVWLLDKCVAYAKAHKQPEKTDQTIWQMFEAERPHLVGYAGPFDGFHSVPAYSTIVLEPMVNKVSHVKNPHGAVCSTTARGAGSTMSSIFSIVSRSKPAAANRAACPVT